MSSFLCFLVQEKRESFLKTPMTAKHFFKQRVEFSAESGDDQEGLVEGEGSAAYDRALLTKVKRRISCRQRSGGFRRPFPTG